jgi:hypothetical protein
MKTRARPRQKSTGLAWRTMRNLQRDRIMLF